jgi:lycopene beta-cyclase
VPAETLPLVIVGGGLAGSLAALAMARQRPEQPVLLLEVGASFGGNHRWSFFESDVPESARWLVDPLIVSVWPDHDVRFPQRRRTLDTAYFSISSDQLDSTVRRQLSPRSVRTRARVREIALDHIMLDGGERIDAAGVIDARGGGGFPGLTMGWQKFVGRELHFWSPHGLARPIIMDATVDQSDGYRFVYCLPFDEHRMLVEDTYYSTEAALDIGRVSARIADYAAAQGWDVGGVERQESGVLPVVTGGSIGWLWSDGPPVARLGLRGGFFHPTTGYSLPDAIANALLLAGQRDFASGALFHVFRREAESRWRSRRFYRLLNRMLFHAARPERRYRAFEHFYRLERPVIERFYAGRSSPGDKLRVVSGRPPVPIGKAVAALFG